MQATLEEKATRETITAIDHCGGDLFIFRTTRPQGYDFVPGQYSRLGLAPAATADPAADPAAIIWRPYSITSAPGDEHLEYYGVRVPGGAFTGLFSNLKPGAPIWIEKQRYGFMTIDRFTDGADLWMLATGTGVGPFVAILRDPTVWARFRHIVLAHGVKYADDLSYRLVLQMLQQRPPNGAGTAQLQLVQAATRMNELPADCLRGRLTDLLQNGILEKTTELAIAPEQSRIMMCGNPAMIEDMRRLLHQRGMRPCRRALPGQFVTENYW
jgi:ferredoxin--NADP+ reductase